MGQLVDAVKKHERSEAEPEDQQPGIGAGWETGDRHGFESWIGALVSSAAATQLQIEAHRRRDGPGHSTRRAEPRYRGSVTRERAAGARGARHREVAPHAAREVAADREAEPRALLRARERRVHLHERLEHALEMLRRDPPSGVGHADRHRVGVRDALERHLATRLGELHRVAQEIEHHLLQLLAVRAHRRRVRRPAPGAAPVAFACVCGATSASHVAITSSTTTSVMS